MAAPLELAGDYDLVVSKEEVSEVRRLLRSVDREGSTSLVMEEGLREHGLMRLRGLGREIWEDEDAQAYVDRLRDEWER